MISFTVYGEAKPAGSKSAYAFLDKQGNPRASVTDSSGKKGKTWRTQVSQQAGFAMNGHEMLDEALSVTFRFYRPRPKGHTTQAGRRSATGRRNPYPTTRPDLLKLARAAEDAMTGVVYRDDSCIVDEHLYKRWGTPSRVEITIERMPDECEDADTELAF